LNIELSEVLENNFEEILKSSVDRMEKEYRTSDSDIRIAKDAFEKFIREMYPYREKRYGQNDLVRYQALTESKSSICPLWPIC
jgi:hypothetical protein